MSTRPPRAQQLEEQSELPYAMVVAFVRDNPDACTRVSARQVPWREICAAVPPVDTDARTPPFPRRLQWKGNVPS